ncbi:MAG: M12 family metallo-peptidase [Ketobacteraceae bacterium]|nr:M12 family metallo-peptidase [Ketobacteraceae bacterium]
MNLAILNHAVKNAVRLCGATLLIMQGTLAVASETDAEQPPVFSITQADQFITTGEMRPSGATDNNDTGLILAYSLGGKIVRLELSENTRLMRELPTRSFPEDVKLYRGKISGNESSWARITKIDGVLSGAIYDGETLFLVDSSEETFQAMPPEVRSGLDRTQPVIFRARDIQGVLSCGVVEVPVQQAAPTYNDLINELNRVLASRTVKEFSIDIHTDSQYANRTSGSVESNVMSQMNIVDGIFSEQLDIQFNVSKIETVGSSSGLDTNDSSRLLSRFYNYSYPNSAGLSHLFTGKALDGGSTLGIAYVDAVCNSYGVGVSQAGGRGVAGALTVAHELGHNFGAPHDNQSGPCSHISNQYLMNPYHNDKDEFSSCSIDQINRTVSGVSCYVNKNVDDGGGNNNDGEVLSVAKAIFTTTEPVVISYQKSSGNSLDWVGIYKSGDLATSCSSSNSTYVDWRYAGNTSGRVSFSDLPAGNYQAQMFSNDGYCFIGKSKSVMVGSFDYAIMLAASGLLIMRRRRRSN